MSVENKISLDPFIVCQHEPYKSNTVDAITIKTSWSKCIIQLLHYLYKSTVHRDIRKVCGITIDIQKSKLQEVEALSLQPTSRNQPRNLMQFFLS